MKTVLLTLSISALCWGQGTPPQGGADQPYSVECYYKVQWAGVPETLLEKSLSAIAKDGGEWANGFVKLETLAYHTIEDGRWDYRVTIRFKNSTLATTSNPDETRLIKQLWPDQKTYEREEQKAV